VNLAILAPCWYLKMTPRLSDFLKSHIEVSHFEIDSPASCIIFKGGCAPQTHKLGIASAIF
jgi:hypothetical protein